MPVMSPSKYVWTTPDGLWVIAYHPNIMGEGGTLGIYDSSILSPLTSPANALAHSQASLGLDKEPIQVLSLYPPDAQSEAGRRQRLGPKPLLSYTPDQGPALLVLTTTSLMLVHPHSLTQQSMMNGFAPAPRYTSTLLRCPLNSRWRAVLGEAVPNDSGYAIQTGWMGLVTEDDAAWIVVQRDGEMNVIRAEVGVDRLERWCKLIQESSSLRVITDGLDLETTPLPPINVSQRPGRTTIQSVMFLRLSDDLRGRAEIDTKHNQTSSVGAVIVESQMDQAASLPKTHLGVYGILRHEVELAESLRELSGQPDPSKAWGWVRLASQTRA